MWLAGEVTNGDEEVGGDSAVTRQISTWVCGRGHIITAAGDQKGQNKKHMKVKNLILKDWSETTIFRKFWTVNIFKIHV